MHWCSKVQNTHWLNWCSRKQSKTHEGLYFTARVWLPIGLNLKSYCRQNVHLGLDSAFVCWNSSKLKAMLEELQQGAIGSLEQYTRAPIPSKVFWRRIIHFGKTQPEVEVGQKQPLGIWITENFSHLVPSSSVFKSVVGLCEVASFRFGFGFDQFRGQWFDSLIWITVPNRFSWISESPNRPDPCPAL